MDPARLTAACRSDADTASFSLTINAGVSFTSYDDYTKAGAEILSPTVTIPHNTTYGKNTMIIAVGIDISL